MADDSVPPPGDSTPSAGATPPPIETSVEQSTAEQIAVMLQATTPAEALTPDRIASISRTDFPLVLRGYDRGEVDRYVRRVVEVVREIEATSSPPAAIRQALERVGGEVADILKRAHATAAEVTGRADAEAESRLSGVRQEAAAIRAEADALLSAARAESEAMRAAARSESDRLVSEARVEAETVRRRAEAAVAAIEAEGRRRVKELDADADRVWAERARIVDDVRDLAGRLEALADSATDGVTEEGEAVVDEGPDEFAATTVMASPGETGGEPDTAGLAETIALLPVEGAADVTAETEPIAVPPGGGGAEVPTAAVEVIAGASAPRVIDLHHLGVERVIACFELDGVLVDPGPGSCLPTLLAALGDEPPRALLLTHIHLDHAGAAGALVARWPELEVYVHTRGARHLADPAKLIASATRLYGDQMDRLWGEMIPVPADRLRELSGGESILGGRVEVAYTPGHASHHVAYRSGGTAFVGDVGGVRIAPGPAIPPTPPPDIDLEAWHRSIELIEGWGPDRLAITHFGLVEDVAAHLFEVSERLDRWGAAARDLDEFAFLDLVREEVAGVTDAATAEAYVQAAPPEQIRAGLMRYWETRAGG